MISGFLTSVISSLRPRQHIEERLTLIIDFCHLLRLFSSEAFDKRTNRVSTDVADKHARYISEIAIVSEVEKVTNELGDIGAHRLRRLLFCKRTAIISAAKVRITTARIAPMPCSFAARMAANRSCLLASSCLTPNKDLLYLIRNKVDY